MKNATLFRQGRKAGLTSWSAQLALALVVASPVVHADNVEIEAMKQQLAQFQQKIENLERQLGIQKDAQQVLATKVNGSSQGGEGGILSNTKVEIYGQLMPYLDKVSTSGATAPAPADRPNQVAAASFTGANLPSRTRITPSTSYIGFRGSIDLTDNLKGIWQIESGVTVDGDAGANTLASRNTSAGVKGNWGTVFFGTWDTPYKWTTIATAPLRGLDTANYANILGNPGFRVAQTTTQSTRANSAADAAFDRRQGNSVQYWTPTINGLSGRIGYSVDEGKSASSATPVTAPKLFSLALSYDNGPLTIRYAYERHDDYFGMAQLGGAAISATNTSSKDDGNKLVGIYSFGNTRLTATYERLSYNTNDKGAAANVNKYQRNAYNLSWEQKVGPGKTWITYGNANEGNCQLVGGGMCSTSGLDATQWVLGYAQTFNKYVDLYVSYYVINNGRAATYQPLFLVSTMGPGAETKGLGVGALVKF